MTTRAIQIDLLLNPVIDYRDGSIASGYSVYFYSAGTSTAKNVWTEKEKTNPYTSVTLGSSGAVQVYGDGVYKIVIKDIDGTTVYEWDNVKIQSQNVAVLTKADTYTVTPDDDYILVNTAGGNVTINLEAAATFTHPVCIKNIGANSVVIDPSGAELIEGAATYTISTIDAAVWLFTNGSAWYAANDTSLSAIDAVNMVATVGGTRKFTAKATSMDINTNNEYLRQSDAAGTGWVSLIKANASDRLEFGAVLTTKQWHNGTYTIDFPTNGMAAAKFMLGNSSTIAWFYLNVAPPGWKVLTTGADTILGVSGGAAAFNVNGGTAGGTWTQPDHNHSHTHGMQSHTHTGPSHTHGLGTMAGPNHTHTLATSGSADPGTAPTNVFSISGLLKVYGGSGGEDPIGIATPTTGNPSATALGGDMAADGTGASGVPSNNTTVSDATNGAPANTWRPSASVGKLFQLDTA